jgi:phospholipid/cholesterol/gamma-HCH transport system ATP-binding protein
MITIENVWKKFGTREILRGVNLTIPKGETVCIIGGSGTGKSVTLKHVMRLLEPDEGRIILDGQDISHIQGRTLAAMRRKLGVLFQSAALLQWLTVGENVALPLRENTELPESEIQKQVNDILRLLQIPQAKDLYPKPTSGLDPVKTALVDEMILDMQEKLGVTQVVVTHDMASAYRIANRIAMLYEGKVIQYGTPDDIKNTENPIVRQFIEGLTKGPIQ